MSSPCRMAALHDLCWDFLFSHQMICKQHIVLNHVFFRYESNLEPVTQIHYHIFLFQHAKDFGHLTNVTVLVFEGTIRDRKYCFGFIWRLNDEAKLVVYINQNHLQPKINWKQVTSCQCKFVEISALKIVQNVKCRSALKCEDTQVLVI